MSAWDIRFAESEAAKGWDALCQQAPGNTLTAWEIMRADPAPRVPGTRHHRLHGDLATGVIKGRALEHWQLEVTGSGRIWYLLDRDTQTVWIDYAGCGHPRDTA